MGCDQSKVNNKAALPLSPSRMDRIITIESEQKQVFTHFAKNADNMHKNFWLVSSN